VDVSEEIKKGNCVTSLRSTNSSHACRVTGFAPTGTLEVELIGSFEYAYDVLLDNLNARTIQGFSTTAREKFWLCENCPYVDYVRFVNYYGTFDYADHWVQAAASGAATDFNLGNADFSQCSRVGRSGKDPKDQSFVFAMYCSMALRMLLLFLRDME
jgi:hypothetical protein